MVNTGKQIIFSCRFHGIPPSKKTADKRARKLAEEVSKKRSNAAEVPEGENTIERVAALQQQAAAPYLVLSGKARPWPGVWVLA